MNFDPTVTLGNIATIAIVLVSIFVAALRISLQIKQMEWKTNMIWKWYAREHGIDVNGSEK